MSAMETQRKRVISKETDMDLVARTYKSFLVVMRKAESTLKMIKGRTQKMNRTVSSKDRD